MATSATITHSSLNDGTPLTLWCQAVVPSISANNSQIPADNKSYGLVEVQTKSIENPKIVIQGLQLRDDILNAFNEEHILELAQLSYDSTNAPVLNVTYGKEIDAGTYTDGSSYDTTSTTYTNVATIVPGYFRVASVHNYIKATTGSTCYCQIYYDYEDGTFETVEQSTTSTSNVGKTYTNPYPYKRVTNVYVFLKSSNGSDAYVTLNVLNLTAGERQLKLLGGSTDIKVLFSSSTIPIDVTLSEGGYVPVVNMTLIETK